MDGFILLSRKITESWIYKKPEYFQWFIHFLLKANFKDNDKVLFDGVFLEVKRGSFITSYRKLVSELNECTERKLRTFLSLLETSQTIEVKTLVKATQITICNYDIYQSERHSCDTVATQLRHSCDTVATTIERKRNKENKENKENNNTFNFKNALLEIGVSEKIVSDWLIVRKNKKATNTETAFKEIKKQIEISGISADECIKFATIKNWCGFKAEWMLIGTNTLASSRSVVKTIPIIEKKEKTDADYLNVSW